MSTTITLTLFVLILKYSIEANDQISPHIVNIGNTSNESLSKNNGFQVNKELIENNSQVVKNGKLEQSLQQLKQEFEEFKTKIQTNIELNENELNETRKQLIDTTSLLNLYLNKDWIHSNPFNDSDGKHRAFIFPLNENKRQIDWYEANNTCNKYNASLVEINSREKLNILKLFLKQFDRNNFHWFWLNAREDSSGKWKWLRSGNDFTYTNWYYSEPKVGEQYLMLSAFWDFGKWFSNQNTHQFNIICELEVNSNELKQNLKYFNYSINELIEIIDIQKQLQTNKDMIEEQLKVIENIRDISKEHSSEIQKSHMNTHNKLNDMSTLLLSYLNIDTSRSFLDSDGKYRAFIFPVNENYTRVDWEDADYICNKYNASLVEINSKQKQDILESYLKQFDRSDLQWFWLNGKRDSSGQWKWMRSGNNITYTNWYYSEPKYNFDYLVLSSYYDFGQWFTNQNTHIFHVICETEVLPKIYSQNVADYKTHTNGHGHLIIINITLIAILIIGIISGVIVIIIYRKGITIKSFFRKSDDKDFIMNTNSKNLYEDINNLAI